MSFEQVSVQPFIRIFPRLFTAAECDYLIDRATPLLKSAVIVDPIDQQLRPNPVRSSHDAGIPWVSEDLVIHALNRRIAKASGTDVMASEPLYILRYSPGQEYLPHVDTFAVEENQRIATVLVYLNDGYSGGETHFTRINATISGGKGNGLLFRNVLADGTADEMTQHAGRPVLSGEKFIASRWIRERPLVKF